MDRQAALNNPLVWILGGALTASWIFGAFHAWQAHTGWQAMAALLLPPYGLYMAAEQELGHPPPREAVSTAAAQLDGYRKAKEQACREDAAMYEKSRLGREQYEVWCSCSTQMIASGFTVAEVEYVKENQKNSPEFRELIQRARQSCYATARYLGAPATPAPVEK